MSWSSELKAPGTGVNWKKNLAALWLSQFLSLSAFSFSIPFFALYIKNENIVPADDVAQWSGIFNAAASVSLMIMSPIWGVLGDRYGRKMMLVRANLGGAFVLYIMGLVTNIDALVALRLLQGAFTGTTPAAQTLVTTATPDRNQGFAMGLLMAAVNAGNMAGFYFGGICAKYYGPTVSFKISGIILFVSTLLVVFAVKENFIPPLPLPENTTQSARIRMRRESITNFVSGLPVLLVIGYIAYLQTFDGPFLSLYIDSIFRATPAAAGLEGAALQGEVYGLTGSLSLLSSIGAMFGSIAAGIVMDRRLPLWTWVAVAAATGVGVFWISQYPSLHSLGVGRAFFLMFISSLASVLVVILGRMAPSSKRGAALGWSVTVRAVGWTFAPLTGAYISQGLGYPRTYGLLTAMCVILVPVFIYLVRRYASAFHPEEEDPPSIGDVGKTNMSQPTGQGRVV